jgi:hypothetical protein
MSPVRNWSKGPGRLLDASATCAKIELQIGGGFVSMPTYVTREEFEARVGVLEREVEGERLVTRHILEQTRRNGDDLATIKGQLDGVDLKRLVQKVDSLESKVDGLEWKIGSVDVKLTALAHSLPTMIGETVREAVSKRRKKT